jgi:hypothetical protein
MIETATSIAAYLEEGGLAAEWRMALNADVKTAVALTPVSVDLLSNGELTSYRLLEGTDRRRAWLMGRAALKRLLRRLDRNTDTSRLVFPAPGISLAQAGGLALAIACDDLSAPAGFVREDRCLGLGLEMEHPFRRESARVFLSQRELERLAPMFEGQETGLLRARTIKEAVFKADPGNRGRGLADYCLADPAARKGRARLREDIGKGEFRYISHRLSEWHISAAVKVP